MRFVLPLILAVCALLPPGLRAEDPARLEPAERNTSLAPTPESADTRLSPGRESNQRIFFRNEVVQDQRFAAPDNIERKPAAVGDKRAAIDVTETREKTIIDRKDFPTPGVRDRRMSTRDGQKSFIQPEGDQIRTYDKVSKYQNGMAAAQDGAFQRKPSLEKRTTFDKLNRFVFQRNGPGTEGGAAMVTPAAGGPAPPSRDTYVHYKIDWQRFDPPK